MGNEERPPVTPHIIIGPAGPEVLNPPKPKPSPKPKEE